MTYVTSQFSRMEKSPTIPLKYFKNLEQLCAASRHHSIEIVEQLNPVFKFWLSSDQH